MTIAISMKVNDGIVLAADSASSIIAQDTSGKINVVNIYNNANKIVNLNKGLPIGMITWGSGSIGHASIATLAKDFRKYYKIDKNKYNIEEISKEFKKFIYDDNYVKQFEKWPNKPGLGFMIVGYSSGQPLAEEWKIDIQNGTGVCQGPYKIRDLEQVGLTWNGEPEAITRLYLGFSANLPSVLKQAQIDEAKVTQIIEMCKNLLTVPMVTPPMPIQDAIDLAKSLVETTVNFSRFSPGAPTVGGPIEIATITKHEGFKWVSRKYYFESDFNPQGGKKDE